VEYFVFECGGDSSKGDGGVENAGRRAWSGLLDCARDQARVFHAPARHYKALRLVPDASYAWMVSFLSPDWAIERCLIGAGEEFLKDFGGIADWASEACLRELIGPNFGPGRRPVPKSNSGTNASTSSSALQDLWANAFDAWISPVGMAEPHQVVYMRPIDHATASSSSPQHWPTWVTETLKLAEPDLNSAQGERGLFALTATDPLGVCQPPDENQKRNLLLERDLQELCAAPSSGLTWWHGFGFAADYHEKGFIVAAEVSSVLELARKYEQGAVYRYRKAPPGSAACFLRETVPVCIPEVEASILVAPCERPPTDTADPAWTPASGQAG